MIRSTHSGVTDSGCWDITVGRTITHTDLQNPLGRASAAGAASSWHAPLQPHKGSLCVPPECDRVQTCLRATICAFLFPSVYLCMSLRVHVSWYLWPVYELQTRCAGWDPTSQWDSTDWGQERKWVSILSSHCCIVVGGGRLVLVRWPRREEKLQGAGVGKRGKGVGGPAFWWRWWWLYQNHFLSWGFSSVSAWWASIMGEGSPRTHPVP